MEQSSTPPEGPARLVPLRPGDLCGHLEELSIRLGAQLRLAAAPGGGDVAPLPLAPSRLVRELHPFLGRN